MRLLTSQVWAWLMWAWLALARPDEGYSTQQTYRYYGYGRSPAGLGDQKYPKVYEILYPYYQRPRYRYPFYDHEGNGELLYGYGGPRLFKYTVFKPVEGYLRR